MKKCKECKEIKNKSDFYGVQGECKECTRKRINKSSRNIEKKCTVCGKKFGTCVTEIKRGGGKYCSRECFYVGNKGTQRKYSDNYHTIHKRIEARFGKPKYCEICKKTNQKQYEWSNKDHEYSENKEDWQRLCSKCHRKYDIERKEPIEIECFVCGRFVVAKSKKRKFCSKACSSTHYRRTK